MKRTERDDMPVVFQKALNKSLAAGVLKMLGADIALTAMLLFCTFPLYMLLEEDQLEWVYILAALLVQALIVYLGLRNVLKNRRDLIGQLTQMGSTKADGLAQQIETEPLLYKTLFLLEEYLYFPRQACLIPYANIVEMKTIYHSTNGFYDGAQLEFKLTGRKKKLLIQMKKINKFYDEHDDFTRKLGQKIQSASVNQDGKDFR